MSRRSWLLVGGLLVVLVALVVLVVLVASASDTPTVTVPTVPLQGPPSPSSTTTTALATAVLAMGTLSDPANTFYELLDRPSGAAGWTLATPPGVADNGGLVVGPSTTGAVTAGFLPAADLTFSVLAGRAAGSTTWTPGDVPGTLAAEPDALATGPTGQTAAVLSGTDTPVEAQAPGRLAAEPGVFGGAPGAEVFVEIVRRIVAPGDGIERLGGPTCRLARGPAAELINAHKNTVAWWKRVSERASWKATTAK